MRNNLVTRRVGLVLVTIAVAAAGTAPFIAPHAVDEHFGGLLNAPPTIPRLIDADGSWHLPFIHRSNRVSQLEQRYEEDRSVRVPLVWLSRGRLVRSANEVDAPLLLLGARDVFVLLAAIFAIVGAPSIARGVRAIVRSERRLEYAAAAQALGASDMRLLARHLLPAARGFLAVQITVLIPAFIVAEATLSYVGLGFPDEVASWGTMLHDASTNIRVFADFPWLLSPAAAMFLVVLGLNLVLQEDRRGDKTQTP